ncbi:MAG: hypothetical protein HOP33_05495 [Verrucomicrobia bacterium]|nr:hypothetical protein [Verrucomicrobiota bacterium]
MKEKSKLQQQQHEEQTTVQHAAHKAGAREFQSAEEMMRFDAGQTRVPDSVKSRLADSLAREQKPEQSTSWWRRLLRG